jgi:hypothetical protein
MTGFLISTRLQPGEFGADGGESRFNGFRADRGKKPLKRLFAWPAPITGLKPGANESAKN